MKPRPISSRPTHRVRKFTREILLASAITLAAIIVFMAARDDTEFAAAPPVVIEPAQPN
jgi:hypothetical protein